MSDNFGETLDENTGKGQFKKTVYLSLKPGEYTIRILDSSETKQYGHFMGKGWIACLGDECPICLNNKKILYEHPEDYASVSGWYPRRARFSLNVLDRADGIVKVLQCGPRLIEDLKVMSKSIRNEQDERIDIRHYDWTLIVKGDGRNRETTPSHKFYGKETAPEYGEQTLYDLSNIMIKLDAEEMLDVFNGASLTDIFKMRRAKKEISKPDTGVSDEVHQDLSQAVDELFGG